MHLKTSELFAMLKKPCQTLTVKREQHGLSIEELAELTAIPAKYIAAFELGTKKPWGKAVKTLSGFFGVRAALLFPEITREPPYRRCLEVVAARKKAGLTQTELSHLCGVERDHLSRFETGGGEPWPAAIAKICMALKKEPAAIFPQAKQGTLETALKLLESLKATQVRSDAKGANSGVVRSRTRKLLFKMEQARLAGGGVKAYLHDERL